MKHAKGINIIESFNAAIEGFLHVIRTQRNMRIHFIAAVGVLLAGIYLNFEKTELMILCLTATFVLMAEMFNTAVEFLSDRLITTHDEKTKIIKDISAGTVLVASVNAVIVAYFLFARHTTFGKFDKGLIRLRQSDWHITFLALILIIAVVIFSKAILHKGTPLRGGMPSGHAAVSFSMCTIITLVSANALISVLAVILAILVSHSRFHKGPHTFWEVFAGALLGVLMTLIVYQAIINR